MFIGEYLKQIRIKNNLALPDISKELNISIWILEAIENDEFFKTPGGVYTIGFIRAYANYLNLDSNEIINKYKTQLSLSETPEPIELPKPVEAFFPATKMISFLAIISISIVFYFMFLDRSNLQPQYAITPNIPEAEVLTGYSILNKEDMLRAAKKILNMGPKNVLLKGGHLENKMICDILVTKKEIRFFQKRKIKTKNTHGTGCTLSSALATCLSQKKNIVKSCKISLKYTEQAIISAPNYGKGFGPLNHLVSFNLRNTNV